MSQSEYIIVKLARAARNTAPKAVAPKGQIENTPYTSASVDCNNRGRILLFGGSERQEQNMQTTNRKNYPKQNKTPAQASQTTNRSKPTGRKKLNAIWSHTTDGVTLSIVPRSAGRVAVRIGHRAGRYYRALCCQVLPSRLLAMDMDSPLGSIIMDGVDVMSPELCRAKEYRDDEHGYTKHLVVTRTAKEVTVWSLTCTLCARDADGHICSAGDCNHTISIQVDNQTVHAMLECVEQYASAHQNTGAIKAHSSEKELDIYAD